MKILIADDEPRIVKQVSALLQKQGFTVDVAMDGEETFQKAKKQHYEVILLDVEMPQKSGFDVIYSLRAIGVDTPIIMLSGRTTVKDKIFAINAGADDYMVKSFCPDELLARIKSVIRRTAKRGSNVLYCGPLCMNLTNMTVSRGQETLQLSKKEFALLLTLMKRKNQVVNREYLIETVWPMDEKVLSSNTLDVHIRFLREKIDLPKRTKSCIQTFRGRGYMLKA